MAAYTIVSIIVADVAKPEAKFTEKDVHELLESHISTIEGTSRHTGALIPLHMDATLEDAVVYFTLDVYRW